MRSQWQVKGTVLDFGGQLNHKPGGDSPRKQRAEAVTVAGRHVRAHGQHRQSSCLMYICRREASTRAGEQELVQLKPHPAKVRTQPR